MKENFTDKIMTNIVRVVGFSFIGWLIIIGFGIRLIVIKNILIIISIIITGTFIWSLITSLRRHKGMYPDGKEYFMDKWFESSLNVIMLCIFFYIVMWVINVFIFYFEYH